MRPRLTFVALVAAGCAHPPPAPPPPAPNQAAAETQDAEVDDLEQLVRLQPAPDIGGPRWGLPTIGGGADVTAALEAVGAGRAQPADLAAPLVIGPALWTILVKLDPALTEAGTTSINPLPHRTGPKQTMEMRSFTHEPERAALLRSPGFRKIGRAFGPAKVRAADGAERELFYLLVPIEVRQRDIYIAERDADRLVVFLDEKRRPAWLDVLSAYAAGGR